MKKSKGPYFGVAFYNAGRNIRIIQFMQVSTMQEWVQDPTVPERRFWIKASLKDSLAYFLIANGVCEKSEAA